MTESLAPNLDHPCNLYEPFGEPSTPGGIVESKPYVYRINVFIAYT
jgi:hypothetical protein